MDKDDVERDAIDMLLWLAFFWLLGWTFKRMWPRFAEPFVWAGLAGAIALGVSAAFFPGLGPASTAYNPNGQLVRVSGGNEAGLWWLVGGCAAAFFVLSLLTWEAAQIRRLKRQLRRQAARDQKARRQAAQREEWLRRALS